MPCSSRMRLLFLAFAKHAAGLGERSSYITLSGSSSKRTETRKKPRTLFFLTFVKQTFHFANRASLYVHKVWHKPVCAESQVGGVPPGGHCTRIFAACCACCGCVFLSQALGVAFLLVPRTKLRFPRCCPLFVSVPRTWRPMLPKQLQQRWLTWNLRVVIRRPLMRYGFVPLAACCAAVMSRWQVERLFAIESSWSRMRSCSTGATFGATVKTSLCRNSSQLLRSWDGFGWS